jgi:hypothetical protein
MYGDYELIEEIAASRSAVVHRARRKGREYAVKVFRPPEAGAEDRGASRGADELAPDPFRHFIQAAAAQRDAVKKGARHLAPIHDAGRTGEEAWYATDHYPRGSLKDWIARRVEVDAANLRGLIGNVLQALTEFQRLTGRAHGNLKAANVLLGGRKGESTEVGRTAVFLTDPQPATAGDGETAERADLRALGELILQLITGREINSPDDYNYPIESTDAWHKLGDEEGEWLARCNKLVNPRLTLADCTLAEEARKLRPSRRLPSAVWKVAAAVVVCVLLAGLVFLLMPHFVGKGPVASTMSVGVTAGEAKELTLSGTGPEPAKLRYEVVDKPTQGQLGQLTGANLSYTAGQAATGRDQFTFRVQDGVKTSAVATVKLTITPYRSVPVATAQEVTATAGEAKDITLSGTGPEPAKLKFEVVDKPTQGQLGQLTGASLSYTAGQAATGSDQFTFRVQDGVKTSAVATVKLTITPYRSAPEAKAQEVAATAGEAKDITLSGTGPEPAKLKFEVVDKPTKGQLGPFTGASLSYTAGQAATGSDQFTFRVQDGVKTSAMATVRLTIENKQIKDLADRLSKLKQAVARLSGGSFDASALEPYNKEAKSLKSALGRAYPGGVPPAFTKDIESIEKNLLRFD